MIALGIDPGMSKQNPCGLALVQSNPLSLLRQETFSPARNKMPWHDFVVVMAWNLDYAIREYRQLYGLDVIVYELPHVAINPQTAIKLAHIGGMIITVAATYHIPCVGIQPSEAKKALTGKGNATKTLMMFESQERFGIAFNKDIADACGIAMAGLVKYQARGEKYECATSPME
jgi:Holliday junction resolvasome RuvABC endonuclease subunit